MARSLSYLLATCWSLLAAGKLLSHEADPNPLLPQWLMHASATIEIAVALGMLSGWRRWACWVGMAFCATAMVLAAAEPGATCACVGGLRSGGLLRYLVAGSLGALCATLLAVEAHRAVAGNAAPSGR